MPLIFLTAADEETEVIMGLDLGGDDYITKPFKRAVLFSRGNALLRFGAGAEFVKSPLFAVSPVGIVCGVVGVLTVFDKSNSLGVGDTIRMGDTALSVAGSINEL